MGPFTVVKREKSQKPYSGRLKSRRLRASACPARRFSNGWLDRQQDAKSTHHPRWFR